MQNNLKKKILNYDIYFDKTGVLFIEQTKTIVLADLHFGKAKSLNISGFQIPPYDIKETLYKLKKVIEIYKPSRIITLGDNFHDKFSILNMNNQEIIELNKITETVDFKWVTGNHDKKLFSKDKIGGKFFNSFQDNDLSFKHIKSKNNSKNSFEFSGHFHPKTIIKINNSSYSYKCFVVSRDFCILPSFGHFTGGIDVKSKVFSDIIDKNTFLIILGKTKIAQQKVI